MSTPVDTFGGLDDPGLSVLMEMQALGADPRDLSAQQLNDMRTLFARDDGLGLYCFTYFICGAHDLYFPLHFSMCQVLSQWGYLYFADGTRANRPMQEGDNIIDNWRRIHLCVPRDHFKTTVGTRATALWNITHNTELTIGIWNENGDKSKSWVGATKKVVEESKLYHLLWPHVLPRGIHFQERERGISSKRNHKWGDTGLLFVRDSHMVAELSIEPFGIGGASAGKHFTHVIKDDIIGDKAAESESVMNDSIDWVNTARALERPAENGCELVNYTRWGYYDVYKHMLTKWKGQYKVYLRHMLEDSNGNPDVVNGNVIFPTRFTTAQAREMYEQDPFVFMSQYMCIPMSGRTTSFQFDWFRNGSITFDSQDEPNFLISPESYDPHIMHSDLHTIEPSAPQEVPLHMMSKAIIIDPAPSRRSDKRQEPRARNGLVVVGKDPWGRNYALEGLALREDPVEVMYSLVALMKKWRTTRVAIEEVVFSAVYAPLWQKIMYHEYPDIFPEWIAVAPKGRDKDQRIFTLAGPMKQGFWYFNTADTGYITQELLEFPNGETKDLIDAMSYTEEVVSRNFTPEEELASELSLYSQDQGRSAITGY